MTVRQADAVESRLEVVSGMRLPHGWISPHFAAEAEGGVRRLQSPRVLLHDGEISSLRTLLPVLEDAVEERSELLIVARGYAAEVTAALALNAREGVLRVAAISAPDRDVLDDLAALSGATVVGDERGIGLSGVGQAELGLLGSAAVGPDETLMAGASHLAERAAERAAGLRAELAATSHHQRRRALHERLASLTEGVVVIHVGGTSEVEARERLDRTQDAVSAAAAAMAEGVVPGGGAALLHAAGAAASVPLACNAAQRAGANAMREALEAPLRRIADNAGADGSYVVARLRGAETPAMGFDARRGEILNMLEAGIVDPIAAPRAAIACARSIAGMLVSSEAVIVSAEERDHA